MSPKTAKTARQLAFERTGQNVEAVVLTRNDPTRLNACLWSIHNQTLKPGKLTIINTGGWLAEPVGGTLDIISEHMEVSLRRIQNGSLGSVHFECLIRPTKHDIWFFQDDAVASPNCLELLVTKCGAGDASLPMVVYPDYEPMPGEDVEIPQEVANTIRWQSPKNKAPQRGPCLGILIPTEKARKIAQAIHTLPMGLDDAIVKLARPTLVPDATVYHTRPERPRWNRIVAMMKQEVLPWVKLEDE